MKKILAELKIEENLKLNLSRFRPKSNLSSSPPVLVRFEVSIFEKGHFKIRKCSEKSNQNGKCLKRLSYEQRIKILGLDFLEWRRKRGDLISTFKLIKGLDSAKLINNFNINSSLQGKNLKRHKFQMKRELVKNCPARYYFLMNRVAPIWNLLPD